MMRRTTVGGAVALLTGLLVSLLGSGVAVAQDTGWQIDRFDVAITVTDDGRLDITETIEVDFRSLSRRGIFRQLPVVYDLPEDATVPEGVPADWQRRLEVSDLEVDSPTGAPTDVDTTGPGRQGRDVVWRIGDPDVTVSGPQTYVLRYEVEGALDVREGEPELFWNATGDRWPVPIVQAEVRVTGQPVARATCFAGRYGATDNCETQNVDGSTARYRASDLQPGAGLTVAARFPSGEVEVGAPILRRTWSLSDAFTGDGLAFPLAALVALAGAGGVGFLLNREGRDRVARGSVTATGRIDPARPEERRRGVFEPRPVAVEFRPPDDLRPGQLGVIIDERVDPVDVSATIVDLAVRGFLTIEEQRTEKRFWRDDTDWVLRRGESDRQTLLRFERRLYDALFEGRDEVAMSDLMGEFASDYALVEKDLYADAQSRHWFARRPDHVRSRWLGIGIGVAVLGVIATVVLANTSRIAIVGIPLFLTGVALAIGHRWMPRRTGTGSRLLTRTLGFREFIETADADRLRFAEAEGTFSAYLPYAVVFGVTERWAEAFADLGVDVGAAVGGWYIGYHDLTLMRLSAGLGSFSSVAATSLTTVPQSSPGSGGGFSGGGFSGGGFGGGGGGSW